MLDSQVFNSITQQEKMLFEPAGYKYKTKAPLGWHYVEEGVEPLDKSIFDFHVKQTSSRVICKSHRFRMSFNNGSTVMKSV